MFTENQTTYQTIIEEIRQLAELAHREQQNEWNMVGFLERQIGQGIQE